MFVVNVFYDLYKKIKRDFYKEIFKKIVLDLLEYVLYKELLNEKICFMYILIIDYYVYNVNFLYVEFLVKIIDFGLKDIVCLSNLIECVLNYLLFDFCDIGIYLYVGLLI